LKMVGKMLTEVTEQNFDEEVLNSHLPVFACFTASWCSSCFPTCFVADELFGEYNGKVKFIRLDTEKNAQIAERYHIIAVPTILIFQNAREVNRFLGFQDRGSLIPLLDSMVAG
jgi:thioredoxin 1